MRSPGCDEAEADMVRNLIKALTRADARVPSARTSRIAAVERVRAWPSRVLTSGRGLRRQRRHDRNDCGYGHRRGQAQRAHHLSPIHAGHSLGNK